MSGRDGDLATFEGHRARLLALAYRMLGDVGRAEDVVQEAWVRWSGRETEAHSSVGFLVAIVTRLCLNELDSARTRREESRGDRLPEPVALEDTPLHRVEAAEHLSMAFMVLLQRLTPAERAVLLLHDVLDYDHARIGALLGKTEGTSRKLLERARSHVATERRLLETSPEMHARLLEAFMRAAWTGDVVGLTNLLAPDAVLITDGGPEGRRTTGIRNLTEPLLGAERIAAFVAFITSRTVGMLTAVVRRLNGQPAMVLYVDRKPFAAMLLGVAEDRVHRVFFHADTARLGHVGDLDPSAPLVAGHGAVDEGRHQRTAEAAAPELPDDQDVHAAVPHHRERRPR